MKHTLIILALAAACGSALAQDAPAAAQTCVACHGERGAKPIAPEYPVLAGQHASYLEHALTEYKTGKRKNPVMAAQATQLDDKAIEELSRYFSLQEGPLYTPSVHGAN